jgi:hypothetical protein
MKYLYLDNLKYDRDELLSLAKSIEDPLWKLWVNPDGRKSPYTQISYKEIKNKSPIDAIVNQLNINNDSGKIVILRYSPNTTLKPHTDWINACAILIGLTENSHIEFWKRKVCETVYYTHPILANLEVKHSVNNDSDQDRYILKIPTEESFRNVSKKLKGLYNDSSM